MRQVDAHPAPRILVVDDEPPVAALVTRILNNAGFEARGFSDPTEATKEARKFRPHLVVSDMDMPGLNGSELCILLKSSPETKSIPVVFLSAHILEEDHDMGLFSGASAYLDKPIDAPALVRTVRSLVRRAAP